VNRYSYFDELQMKPLVKTSFIAFLFLCMLTSCRKPVVEGTKITAEGIVFDEVKNKPLPNARLYVYGAHQTFYGIGYANGPIDSTVSDASGKFSMQFEAEGHSVDYGLRLEDIGNVGYNYSRQINYVIDWTEPVFKFNYSHHVTNAKVKGRELNYTRINLKVLSNPFDSFMVETNAVYLKTLVTGQSIDTTILVRHLPNSQNIIRYYTESLRDTVGLAALNTDPYKHMFSITRAIYDTVYAGMEDTIFINKTILNSGVMPRQ